MLLYIFLKVVISSLIYSIQFAGARILVDI